MRAAAAILIVMALAGGPGRAQDSDAPAALRVCADPDNLPFSHQDRSGFENRIAQLAADDLQLPLRYAWLPDRRGFVRKTIGADACDLIVGVPVGDERVLTTRPYYRSTYVFVQRADVAGEGSVLRSFEDPRLPALRIGVQLVGNDLAATPPGYALARHGAVGNVRGFTLYGEGPPAERMVHEVAAGALDAAVVWGPQAGYFAARASQAGTPLRVTAAPAPPDLPLPFAFAIAMGVRKGDQAMQQRLNDFLQRRAAEIDAILDAYAVPRLALEAQ
jgi:mxaJ protein